MPAKPTLPSQLHENVRKAGLGLCIVSALPVFIALIVIKQGTGSKEPYVGFVVGAALAGLGGLILTRRWPALYFAALLCAVGALGMSAAALKEQTYQGLLLSIGLGTAAVWLWKVGGQLRSHFASAPPK